MARAIVASGELIVQFIANLAPVVIGTFCAQAPKRQRHPSKRWVPNDVIRRLMVLSLTCLLLLSFALTTEPPAYGYVDPGSGSLFTQLIGSFVTAALFSVRRRIASLFRVGRQNTDS